MVKLNQIAKLPKHVVWNGKSLKHNLCNAIKMKKQNKLAIKKISY